MQETVNPFSKNPKQNSSPNAFSNSKIIKSKVVKEASEKDELTTYKKEYYKQKFDDLEDQIDIFKRKLHREAYIEKIKPPQNNFSNENYEGETPRNDERYERGDNVIIQKEKVIVQGGGCLGGGCFPFSWIFRVRCCGCFIFLILLIVGFVYAFLNIPFVRDFSLVNIFPLVVGQPDSSKIPDPRLFSIPDNLVNELIRVEKSDSALENITIYQSELNSWLLSYHFTVYNSETEKSVRIEDGKAYLYIRRKDLNEPWTILTFQSDNLGKPQIIEVQYGGLHFSGENARDFVNNIPFNLGNINLEKIDDKIDVALFGENPKYRIDKIVFLTGKMEISLIKK